LLAGASVCPGTAAGCSGEIVVAGAAGASAAVGIAGVLCRWEKIRRQTKNAAAATTSIAPLMLATSAPPNGLPVDVSRITPPSGLFPELDDFGVDCGAAVGEGVGSGLAGVGLGEGGGGGGVGLALGGAGGGGVGVGLGVGAGGGGVGAGGGTGELTVTLPLPFGHEELGQVAL
jgi:hypothetical protein